MYTQYKYIKKNDIPYDCGGRYKIIKNLHVVHEIRMLRYTSSFSQLKLHNLPTVFQHSKNISLTLIITYPKTNFSNKYIFKTMYKHLLVIKRQKVQSLLQTNKF